MFGEHPVNFSEPFTGYYWAEPGRKKTLYVADRIIYRLLLEIALGAWSVGADGVALPWWW
jgi:hypothetical protein